MILYHGTLQSAIDRVNALTTKEEAWKLMAELYRGLRLSLGVASGQPIMPQAYWRCAKIRRKR